MKIIIPMAGWGTRLRPHTLTIPKPMLPVAGKPIVQWLVENLVKASPKKVEDVVFVIREDFGKAVEEKLLAVAKQEGINGHIKYQDTPLGTAHAVLCAGDFLTGNVIVAFADTLFKSDFKIDTEKDGIVWVQQIEDPSAFGVVTLNAENVITGFVEKPKEFVSDLSMIGIYYFKDGAYLRSQCQYLLDNDLKQKGEFWLTDALERMKNDGKKLHVGKVIEWLDCGNKNATVYTNQRVLELNKDKKMVSANLKSIKSQIIEPCFIDDDVAVVNSVVGPHVSIGKGSVIENSIIKNSIVQSKTIIKNKVIENSMIGNNVKLEGKMEDLSIGDHNVVID